MVSDYDITVNGDGLVKVTHYPERKIMRVLLGLIAVSIIYRMVRR